MGLITAIEPQARHANRFNLYIDDEFAFGLSAILAAKVRVGQTLSDEERNALEREENFETGYEKALRFLEPRPRSSSEVKQQLFKKKFDAETIARVLARLTDAGLLDDAAFAKYWVENREQFRPRAGRALKFELRRKGVGDTAIKAAVGEIDESESAYRAGTARALRWRDLEPREFRDKLTAFLIRRGFGYDIAKHAVRRLQTEIKDGTLDA
ncbi:MAG: RecX family transcriptional regulator [Chloroflexi bacterium]|nr:RecX family transcriptional regulator [Chloroflexota bacterium]MBI3741591.1 RecX family transcriptional regulator [Chloroflexota bacterium]